MLQKKFLLGRNGLQMTNICCFQIQDGGIEQVIFGKQKMDLEACRRDKNNKFLIQ